MEAQLTGQFRRIRLLLTQTAALMPADAYSIAPTTSVRTFAAAVAHTASTNFGMCANLTGKPNPLDGQSLEKTVTTKDSAVKALADSFTFCEEYANGLTLAKLTDGYKATAVLPSGERRAIEAARGGLFANLIAHNNEMYGYLAVYLRLKGLVPPSSAPRDGRGRGGQPLGSR
jgi:hypothetical protein